MENEFHNIDDLFRDSFSDYSETPPPAVWPALEKRLDKDKKRRVFPLLRWYWLGALLVFVALLGATITANMKASAPVTGHIDNTPANVATKQSAEMSPVHEKAVPQTVEKVNHSEAIATKHAGSKVEIQAKRQHKSNRKYGEQQTSKGTAQEIKKDSGPASADEVSVYGNAPTVGTSIYSYDDFEQESDVNKGQVNVLGDAQNTKQADYKHKIVVAESYTPEPATIKESELTEPRVGDNVDRVSEDVFAAKEQTAPDKQTNRASRNAGFARTKTHSKETATYDDKRKAQTIASIKDSEPQKVLASRKTNKKAVADSKKGSVAHVPAASAIAKKFVHAADANRVAKNVSKSAPQQRKLALAATPSIPKEVSERPKPKAALTRQVNLSDTRKPIAVAENTKRMMHASASKEHLGKTAVNANPHAAHTEPGKQTGTTVVAHKIPGFGSKPGLPDAASSRTQSAKGKLVDIQKPLQPKSRTEVREIAVKKQPGVRDSPEPVHVALKESAAAKETNAVQGEPAIDKLPVERRVTVPAKQETATSGKLEAVATANEALPATLKEEKAPVKRPVIDKNAKLPPVLAAAAPEKVVSVAEREVALAPRHLPEAQPVALPAKKATDSVTTPAAIAKPEEECPDSTAEGITPFMKFVFGIKGGLESGFSLNAGNKVLIAPYIRYNLSEKVGIQLQPALKVGRLSTRTIGPAAYYHDIHAGSGQYELTGTSLVYLVFSGDTLVRRDYTYTEKYDSIIKQNQVGGTYAEVELPILLQYQAGKRLSVYGGINTVLGKRFSIEEKTKTYRDVTATGQGFSLTRLNEPAILPPSNGVVYTSSPLSSYGGAQYPANSGSILRMGYMLGVSYELKKRWSVDAAVQQCFLQKNIQGGYNVNKVLSAPYFRVTLGYRLTK